jgi:hypothetical protein
MRQRRILSSVPERREGDRINRMDRALSFHGVQSGLSG